MNLSREAVLLKPRLGDLPKILLFAAIYIALAKSSLLMAEPAPHIAPIWSASGFSLGVLVLLGPFLFPFVTLGSLVINLSTGLPVAASLVIAIGSTLEVLVGYFLLKRLRFEPSLSRLQDVAFLGVAAVLVCPFISTSIGTLTVHFSGMTPPNGLFFNSLAWWLGDALGLLIISPMILTWGSLTGSRLRPIQIGENILTLATLVVAEQLIFGRVQLDEQVNVLLIYLVFALVVWIALRFGPRGTALALFISALVVLLNMMFGFGPFSYSVASEQRLILLQAQLGVISFTALIVSAVIAERARAKDEIERVNENLESQVAQRTLDLGQANTRLQAEIGRHITTADILTRSRARLRAIVEDQVDLVSRWLPDTTITFVNSAYCHFFGCSREELIGSSFLNLVAEEDRESVRNKVHSLTPECPTVTYEERVVMPGGDIHWLNWTDRGLFDSENHLVEVQSVGMEITERKQRERELEVAATLSTALRVAPNREHIYRIAMEKIIQLGGVDAALLAIPNASGEMTEFKLGSGQWQSLTGSILPLGRSVTSQVFESGKLYRIRRPAADPDWNEFELEKYWYDVVCLPLMAQEKPVGVLWVGDHLSISPTDVRVLEVIADIIANAIDRSTLTEETQLRLKRLTALRAIDIAITASLDMRVTLGIVLDQLISHLGVDAAGVLLFYPHRQCLEYAQVRGMRSTVYQSVEIGLVNSLPGQVALQRRLVMVSDYQRQQQDPMAVNLQLAGEGFVSYIAVPLVAKGQSKGVLEIFHRQPLSPDVEWLEFLQAVAAQSAIAIDNAQMFDQLQRSNVELAMAYDATIDGWARAFELRNRDTEGHGRRVSELAIRLARTLQVSEDELRELRRGALLHDIGKMVIPDHILFKPGPLDEAEWEIIRMHPTYAYELLISIPYLHSAVDIPYCHHEHWDGSGYPRGLKGDQIPKQARIFAVVDVWDALTSDRPWRKAWSRQDALAYIHAQMGKSFDPQVVHAFLQMEPYLEVETSMSMI